MSEKGSSGLQAQMFQFQLLTAFSIVLNVSWVVRGQKNPRRRKRVVRGREVFARKCDGT